MKHRPSFLDLENLGVVEIGVFPHSQITQLVTKDLGLSDFALDISLGVPVDPIIRALCFDTIG